MHMDGEREKLAILEKLSRCRRLKDEFPEDPTNGHIRELEVELEAELAKIDEADRP
jgi:hypothetical protein